MRSLFARIRTGWDDAGHGTRLGLFGIGIVIAVAAIFGTNSWLVSSADVAEAANRPTVPLRHPIQKGQPGHPSESEGSNGYGAVATVADGRQFLALQDAWEARLTDKAVRALERTFPGRAIVTVNLELSPHTENRSGVNVPVDGLQPNLVETMAAPAGMPTGAHDGPLGRLESDPNRAPPVSAFASRLRREAGGRVHKRQIDVRLYGRKTEVQLAPEIRRITASVVLDEAALATHEDQAATKAAVVDIVKHAIGFDASRGDQMHAPAVMRFTNLPTAAVGTGWEVWTMLAMTSLLFGMFGAVWFVRRAGSNQPPPDAEALALRMRQEIETAIEHDPEVVAEILGEWAMEARR